MILDSSILIAKERGRFALDEFLAAHPDQECFLAAVTVSELWHGVGRARFRPPPSRGAPPSVFVHRRLFPQAPAARAAKLATRA